MLLDTWMMRSQGIDLNRILGLFYPQSEYFMPHQLVTHLFMHGGITHLFFNMFALYMFGRVLESVWGPKRFLIFYFITGLGAATIHTFVNYLEIAPMAKAVVAFNNTPSPELFASFVNKYPNAIKGFFSLPEVRDFAVTWLDNPDVSMYESEASKVLNLVVAKRMNIPTVGASGAVFGVLLGFGMLFPNTQLMLLFPPIPIKAKYFVMAYGALELVLGFSMPGSNIAHFAHLGGMIFGFILIKYWNKTTRTFY
jgi:membrane associated rhomboid family serine protease